MAKRKSHGGARKGAGRKVQGEEPRERINITLTPSECEQARAIGEGNLSLGISRALAIVATAAEIKGAIDD